jgi:hypothetical protein
LVDTIIRDLPVPIIIVRKVFDPTTYRERRQVVDGQQRLRTMFGFYDSTLLSDYSEERDDFKIRRIHNKDLAGKRFEDLSVEHKAAIVNYEFSVHTLPSGTTDREVLEIFSRLNSSGVGLRDQELRNAEFTGAFKTLVYNLGLENLDRWRIWNVLSEMEIARMDEAEMISDLIMLMINGLEGKKQSAITKFYETYEESFEPSEQVYQRFGEVLERIESTIGNILPDSTLSRKTIFPLVYAFYYDMMYGLGSDMKMTKAQDTPDIAISMIAINAALSGDDQALPSVVSKALRGSTNSLVSRQGIHNFFKTVYDDIRR